MGERHWIRLKKSREFLVNLQQPPGTLGPFVGDHLVIMEVHVNVRCPVSVAQAESAQSCGRPKGCVGEMDVTSRRWRWGAVNLSMLHDGTLRQDRRGAMQCREVARGGPGWPRRMDGEEMFSILERHVRAAMLGGLSA